MRTGIAHLPLHNGKAPAWLFNRMKKLARYICLYIVEEFGTVRLLENISNPFWFQALGCVLGFDWHSSGLTTTTCSAIKEGLKGTEKDIGIFCAGGKGKFGLNTPNEIDSICNTFSISCGEDLIRASRLSAKVDNIALQDGYNIYQHMIIFTNDGKWSVIQQGMNPDTHYARRYHWLSLKLDSFVNDPHSGIQKTSLYPEKMLNLVARESKENREMCVTLVKEDKNTILKDIKNIPTLILPKYHWIKPQNINIKHYERIIEKIKEVNPNTFENILEVKGVGLSTLRALALVGDLIYGKEISTKDPATYSYAHGGKDGTPYPVNRRTYDITIEILKKAIDKSKIDRSEKKKAIQRFIKFIYGHHKDS